MSHFGKFLIVLGAIFVAIGLIVMIVPKVPIIGKLPGDIRIKKESFEIYILLATSLLLSLVLSTVFWIINYFQKK